MKKNRYRRALEILKSAENYNAKKINEEPTNNTKGVYVNIDVDQKPSDQYWNVGDTLPPQLHSDFSQKYLDYDKTGTDTSGLIGEDGTVFSQLPPGGENFILGPIVDGFITNESGNYTNIGYLQKDTRQFVLLAKIDGQWEENMNGPYPVWDGTSKGLTIYNQNFTLEMAQWIKEKINNKSYVKNVPYFYSGEHLQEIECPNCPPNMKGGNGIAPNEVIGKNEVFTDLQKEYIDNNLNQFFKDVNSLDQYMTNVGRMARGMSQSQIKSLVKLANLRWGK